MGKGPRATSAAMAAFLAAVASTLACLLGQRLHLFLVLPWLGGGAGASPCGTVLGSGPLRLAEDGRGMGASSAWLEAAAAAGISVSILTCTGAMLMRTHEHRTAIVRGHRNGWPIVAIGWPSVTHK